MNSQNTVPRIFWNILLSAILIAVIPLELSANPKEIQVGVYDNKPLIFMSEAGPQGIYIDILEEIAKAEGWEIRYRYGKWVDVYALLVNQKIDILPGVAFVESRLKDVNYNNQTILANWGQVYVKKELELESIQNLAGKKIATLRNDAHGDYFHRLLSDLLITYEDIVIGDYDEMLEALEEGRLDAGVINYIAAKQLSEKYDIKQTPIVFNPIQIKYAVPKGDPAGLLKALDKHISIHKEDKESVYYNSLEHWLAMSPTSTERVPVWLVWVASITLGVALLLLTGNIFLRSKVKARTTEMQNELHLRRIAEGELKTSETLTRKFISNIGDVIVIIDQNDINRYESPNIVKLFGWNADELVGKCVWDNVHSEDIERTKDFFNTLKNEPNATGSIECRYRCRNGQYKWINFTGVNLLHDTDICGILGTFHDITKRKQAEENERESNQKFEVLFDSSPSATFVWEFHDGDFTLVAVNKAAQKLTENRAKDYVGLQAKKIYADLPIIREKLSECYTEQKTVEFEYYYKNRFKGEYNWILFRITFVDAYHVILYVDNISNRKNAQEKIEFQAKLLNSIGQSVIATDKDGLVIYWNKIAEQIFGWSAEEALGKNIPYIMSEDVSEADRIMKKIISGQSWSGEFTVKRKDGKIIPLFVTDTPIYDEDGNLTGVIGVSVDISQQKEMQVQLQLAQKMESVGRLAGGVAHDFNNMLGVILGYSELLLEQVDDEPVNYRALQGIQEAARRSADLTRQLLAFARKQTVAPRVLELNQTMEAMLTMLQRLIGEDIELLWRPGATPAMVKIDPTQVDQILVNLCVNARDAIDGTGTISIATSEVFLDTQFCASQTDCAPGPYITLTVRDTGCGMDQEAQANIFEPFFTTKDTNKGTGLGLATVFGIVKQNNGFITVDSELGKGSTFAIYLPMYTGSVDQPTVDDEIIHTEPVSETILLVEDEEMILQMTTLILEDLGYHVLGASRPEEAITIAAHFEGTIHLLITDIIMPEMNGRDLKNKLLEIMPDIKILYMSGYTADVISEHGILDEKIQFIQKPFDVKSLAEKVREVLS